MPFAIRAQIADPFTGKRAPGTGLIEFTADTLVEAKVKARSVRALGLSVTITDPEGKPVDEGAAY